MRLSGPGPVGPGPRSWEERDFYASHETVKRLVHPTARTPLDALALLAAGSRGGREPGPLERIS